MTEIFFAIVLSLPYVKYGAYHWLPFWNAKPDTLSKLQWGTLKLESLGLKVIRVPLGYSTSNPFDKQPPITINLLLRTMAMTSDYSVLFNDPSIQTYMLTTYTPQAYTQSASQISNVDAWMNLDLEKERQEYHALAAYLGDTYPDKKFILLNWEADNENPTPQNINLFIGLLQARIDGIARANRSNVFSGIEISQTAGLVFPHLKAMAPDYVSYSIWEVISPLVVAGNTSTSQLSSKLTEKLNVFKSLAGYNPDRIIVGEFGYEQDEKIPVSDYMATMDSTFRSFGLEYAVFWQTCWDAYNNGAFDINGNILPTGRYLKYYNQRRIVSQVAEGKYCIPPSFGIPQEEQ